MRHLRQCRSEDVFSQMLSGRACIPAKDGSPADAFDFGSSDDDYSDPSPCSSPVRDVALRSSGAPPHVDFAEVPSRGDPRCATLYIDIIADLLQREEPAHLPERGAAARLYGSSFAAVRFSVGEWLFSVGAAYPATTEALFQAFSLFDRFLAKRTVPQSSLPLYGACCLWICLKIELHAEGTLEPLLALCRDKFTRGDFVAAEREILCSVDYDIVTVTPYFFVQRFLEHVGADAAVTLVAKFLCESALLFDDFGSVRPSLVALCAAAAACAICGCSERAQRLSAAAERFAVSDVRRCVCALLGAGQRSAARVHGPVMHKFVRVRTGDGRSAADLIRAADFGPKREAEVAALLEICNV